MSRRAARWLLVLCTVLVLTVSLWIARARRGGEPASWSGALARDSTPEEVTQTYLEAWICQDAEKMYQCVASHTRARLSLVGFRRSFQVALPIVGGRGPEPFFARPVAYGGVRRGDLTVERGVPSEATVHYSAMWTLASALGPELSARVWPFSAAPAVQRLWPTPPWVEAWWGEVYAGMTRPGYAGTGLDYVRWAVNCARAQATGDEEVVLRSPEPSGGYSRESVAARLIRDASALRPDAPFFLGDRPGGGAWRRLPVRVNHGARGRIHGWPFRCVREGKGWRIANPLLLLDTAAPGRSPTGASR